MENSPNTVLPPEYQGLTFEKVWAMFQETDKKFRETDKKFQETDRQMREQRQETGRQMKERREEFDREMKKQREEAGREMKKQREEAGREMKKQREEAEREMKKRREEAEQEMKKRREETDRMIQQNQKLMSDLGRKFGKIIEHMFIPNLKEKFNAQGYEFGKASSNVFIENRTHNIYAEIDVFLENGDCALAVEVKTQAGISDIQEHMERMEKLRRYFDLHGDTRKLYGALAAAVIPGNVHDYALKQGFYLIRQSGDTVSIEEPQGKPRAW